MHRDFEELVAEAVAEPTEGHPPNVAEATRLLHPKGVAVVASPDELPLPFADIGAVVHFLRKVVWIVPGFTVDAHRERLRTLHERIETEGPFVAHSSRVLVEARKPA